MHKILKKILFFIYIFFINISLTFALAQPASKGGKPAQGGGIEGLLMLMIPLFIIWYLFLIRPQQKKAKEKEKMLSELRKGNKVMTIGGIFGEIVQIKENRVVLKTADKTTIEVAKSAISSRIDSKKE